MKEIEFRAELASNGESSIFGNIPKEDFIRLVGEEAYEVSLSMEKGYLIEHNEEHPDYKVDVDETAHRLTANLCIYSIFELFGCEKGKQYRFKIQCEKID